MKNNSRYSLDIKGELSKRDSKMVAKIYAYAALIAAVGFSLAAIIAAVKM